MAEEMSQSKEDALAWVKQLFAAIDSLNAEYCITQFYNEDGFLQFGNNPPLQGHQTLIDTTKKAFDVLDMMKHELGHSDVVPDRIYQYVVVSYRVKGDTEVIQIPALTVCHKKPEERKMRRFEVFMDRSPLMEKIKSMGLI